LHDPKPTEEEQTRPEADPSEVEIDETGAVKPQPVRFGIAPRAERRGTWMRLPIFEGIPTEVIEEVGRSLEAVVFEEGAQILQQGAVGDDMYVLDEGSVRVSVRSGANETTFMRILDAPAIFGELALVTNAPRNANVVADSRVHCFRLDRASYEALITRSPHAADFITRAVGERLLESGTLNRVGRYEVVGSLGMGAAAMVFSAMDVELGRPVALKMLSHSLVSRPGFTEAFRREARIIAKLDHEHIVRVLDTEADYGTYFIVMERLNGRTLEDLIVGAESIAWGGVRRILKEIALALDYSHTRGLLHRDVKPANVFLTSDNRAKLLDFGIASEAETSASANGVLIGTPYYMSPEQIRGRKLDGRADLYSLGVLAYELVTRRVPFHSENLQQLLQMHIFEQMPDPRELVPECPEDLVEFILRATQKDPNDRFASCGQAVAYLQTSSELPLVDRFALASVGISFHPTRAPLVESALAVLRRSLEGVSGVRMIFTEHKGSEGKD